MIGRKLVLLKNGNIVTVEENSFEFPDLKELKHLTLRNMKKYGRVGLIVTLRFYIRSTNLLKNQYEEMKVKLKRMTQKERSGHLKEKAEVSKFLKMISEYKHKIREIKHQIKEEENS
jgi:hypothetical protein